jgi:hypothetical protein
VLEGARAHPRVSPVEFDLRRFNRFGVLGLVDPTFTRVGAKGFEIEVVPIGADDAEDRWARLLGVLGELLRLSGGGGDATGGALRPGFDGSAGEGADDSEPARRRHAVR